MLPKVLLFGGCATRFGGATSATIRLVRLVRPVRPVRPVCTLRHGLLSRHPRYLFSWVPAYNSSAASISQRHPTPRTTFLFALLSALFLRILPAHSLVDSHSARFPDKALLEDGPKVATLGPARLALLSPCRAHATPRLTLKRARFGGGGLCFFFFFFPPPPSRRCSS